MKTLFLALALVVLCASQAFAADGLRQAMTVDDAYQAIPHARTRFDAAAAKMPEEERRFLDAFFALTDLAVAERVIQQAGKGQEDNYAVILGKLAALDVPGNMAHAHKMVTEAVQEQRDYLRMLKAGQVFNAAHALVQSSHAKLISAYNALMSAYPSENGHNKQAFFDHLCALDFI